MQKLKLVIVAIAQVIAYKTLFKRTLKFDMSKISSLRCYFIYLKHMTSSNVLKKVFIIHVNKSA